MSDKNKNRVRPVLADLEGRVMADAKSVGALAGALVGHAVTRPVPVEIARPSSVGLSVTLAPRASAVSSFQYTAVTIKNGTNGTVNYSFRWGNGVWTKYALTGGQQRVHYIRALNQVAAIDFDKSFATGVQHQQYSLPGKNIVRGRGLYLVEPTPSVGEGKLYTFRGVSNGVQLYS
jgi:hypothetical protein